MITGWYQVEGADLTARQAHEARDIIKTADQADLPKVLILSSGVTLKWHPAPDSLDAAWAEAEAALPEGWHLCAVERHCHAGDETPGQWYATAHDADRWESEEGWGDDQTAALRALATKLRERQP